MQGFGAPQPMGAPMMAGSMIPGSLGARFLAALIDGLIIGIPTVIVVFILIFGVAFLLKDLAGLAAVLTYPIMFGMIWTYEAFFLGTKGATPGKKIMKLKVVGIDGTFPIGIGKGYARAILKGILGSICFLTYIFIFIDQERRQALHDKVAGTMVVQDVQ